MLPPPAQPIKVKNAWICNMVVTLDGVRYQFVPGETKEVTIPSHAAHLLSLQRPATGCCGGYSPARNYFELVEA